ncbi:hypothetical protein [Achromobacter ruhlandii]|uniref:hypothetical protein n=1 Tax=Achromobacter ruhlandii TaxID=72557 RepID=UPI0007BEE2C0|nr:hypothetical protein [Achromobacter ruhlandii]
MPPAHRLSPAPRLARWAALGWLCACLLLSPLGGVRHVLSHLPGAPASSQDDAHAPDKPGHCDLCHIWDLLDATLPASFVPVTGSAPRIAPPAPAPRGTTIAALPWFQPRAPPATA